MQELTPEILRRVRECDSQLTTLSLTKLTNASAIQLLSALRNFEPEKIDELLSSARRNTCAIVQPETADKDDTRQKGKNTPHNQYLSSITFPLSENLDFIDQEVLAEIYWVLGRNRQQTLMSEEVPSSPSTNVVSHTNAVTLRFWFPRYLSEMGHVSLETYAPQGGIYASLWPDTATKDKYIIRKSAANTFHGTQSCLMSLDFDLWAEGRRPDLTINLYNLNAREIFHAFQSFKSSQCNWSTLGSTFNNTNTRNCVGLTKHLLTVGGISPFSSIRKSEVAITAIAAVSILLLCQKVEGRHLIAKLSSKLAYGFEKLCISIIESILPEKVLDSPGYEKFLETALFFYDELYRITALHSIRTVMIKNKYIIGNDHFNTGEDAGISAIGISSILIALSGITYVAFGRRTLNTLLNPSFINHALIGAGLGACAWASPLRIVFRGIMNSEKINQPMLIINKRTLESEEVYLNTVNFQAAVRDSSYFLGGFLRGFKYIQGKVLSDKYTVAHARKALYLYISLNIAFQAYPIFMYKDSAPFFEQLMKYRWLLFLGNCISNGIEAYLYYTSFNHISTFALKEEDHATSDLSRLSTLGVAGMGYAIPVFFEIYLRYFEPTTKNTGIPGDCYKKILHGLDILSSIVSLYFIGRYPKTLNHLKRGIILSLSDAIVRPATAILAANFVENASPLLIGLVPKKLNHKFFTPLVLALIGGLIGEFVNLFIQSLFMKHRISILGDEQVVASPASLAELCSRIKAREQQSYVSNASILERIGLLSHSKENSRSHNTDDKDYKKPSSTNPKEKANHSGSRCNIL